MHFSVEGQLKHRVGSCFLLNAHFEIWAMIKEATAELLSIMSCINNKSVFQEIGLYVVQESKVHNEYFEYGEM